MPVTKQTYLQEKRQRVKACIASYEQLRMVDNEQLAKVLSVHTDTIRRKKEDPGKFTLEEIWKLSTYLKCSVGELCGGELPQEIVGKWLAQSIQSLS